MPGFTSSQARLTRHGAQASADASLDAQVELSNLVRQGKVSGLGGLERTRAQAGQEQLGAASALGGLETNVATGRRAGTTIISEAERISIANRLASMGAS